MILHLNRSQRAALIRALDFRLAKIRSRAAAGALKPDDEVDELLLDMVRADVLAGRSRHAEASR